MCCNNLPSQCKRSGSFGEKFSSFDLAAATRPCMRKRLMDIWVSVIFSTLWPKAFVTVPATTMARQFGKFTLSNADITTGKLNMLCSLFDINIMEDMSLTTEIDVEGFSLYLGLYSSPSVPVLSEVNDSSSFSHCLFNCSLLLYLFFVKYFFIWLFLLFLLFCKCSN